MNRIFSLMLAIIALAGSCTNNNTNYKSFDGFAQGGTYHITCNLDNLTDTLINSIPDSLDLYFNQINKSLSGYDSTSIISAVNRGENPPLDQLFIETFKASKEVWKESNGAFDVTAGPLFNVWGFGFKNKVPVTKSMVDSIKQFVGNDKAEIVAIDTVIDNIPSKYSFLKLADSRMQINFNAIAQGISCDYIASKFNQWGMTDFLIEVGGEIYAQGLNSKGKEWKVGIDKPLDGNFIPGESLEATIEISNQGLVTSGNYRKYYVENGKKYSHTINPITGYPVEHTLLSATVVAKNAAVADAYATYFMVIGLDEAKKVLAANPDMGAILVYGDQDKMQVWSTNCKMSKQE